MGAEVSNNREKAETGIPEAISRALADRSAMTELEARQVSPLTLAYIGDAIYELMIRTALVETYAESVRDLHRMATALVKAETQSAMMRVYEEQGCLTEEEEAVFHRGRNAKANTHAKNANIQEYRRATGFEAVCGYLYLRGEMIRLQELVQIGLTGIENPFRTLHGQHGRDAVQESRNTTGEGNNQ